MSLLRWFPPQEAPPYTENMIRLPLWLVLQYEIPTAGSSLRQISLYTPHRHALFLSRKIEAVVHNSLSSRHVRPAPMTDVHRTPDKRRRRNALRVGSRPRQGSPRPRHLLQCTTQLGIMNNIALRFLFGDVSHDVDVVWGKAELPCLGKVAGCQCETDGERKTEPEVCGRPQKVVVPPDRGDEPPWRDRSIDCL